ncbi:MAG: gliding motility-associated C-terminal domain-containing protein [Bacteroidota bacterium]
MFRLYVLFVLAWLSAHDLSSQDILLFNEDFESPVIGFSLNTAGPSSNSGNNQWVVNNVYSGAPTYPNTTAQNVTNGGTISFAPNSKYLHIHDAPSGILNTNYAPGAASDRFAQIAGNLCTLGMDNVHFSFFYLCEGSATAFGSIYYSIDGGPWVQFGNAQYSGMTSWQYVDITDPAWANVGNLSFGFRWQNNAASPPNTMSFAVDDVTAVATYSVSAPVTINVTAVSPNPVCQGSFVSISYQLSAPLCDGNYQIELSNSAGNFPSPFNSWVMPINYPTTSGTITVQIPNNVPVGGCYRFRINRLSPPPVITGIASACFEIIACPNVINTLQPVVTMDPFPVCVGSVIDVPFTSTGIYNGNNNYIAQLSNPDGTFGPNPPTVGSFPNNGTYDPALGQLPGNVSGLIPPAVPGCGYYIRVISTNPQAIGVPWGPFCIQECDIMTNDMQDLDFCIHSCSVDPDGETQTIDIDVNTYDNAAQYGPNNLFQTQLLSSQTFAQIGPLGILGEVQATGSTTLDVHVPCKEELPAAGIPTGMNYMRIVATESSTPDNALGSLIRVTIGVYRDEPQIIQSYKYPSGIPSDVFCVGETVQLLFSPYAYSDNSTYMWQCNGINGGQPFVSPSGANSNSLYVIVNSPGQLNFQIQETNYGCVSEWSPVHSITVLGAPNANIVGPTAICSNDTVNFQVPFYPNTYYGWSSNVPQGNIAYQDTSNNVLNISINQVGTYTLNISVLNLCGSDSDSHTVTVNPAPTINAGNDQTICLGDDAQLTAVASSGNNFTWSTGGVNIGNGASITVTPLQTTTYTAKVVAQNGCDASDQVTVSVQEPAPATVYDDVMCPGGQNQLTLNAPIPGQQLWSTGATGQSIVVNNPGTYGLATTIAGQICPTLSEFQITPISPAPATMLTDSICPGGGNDVLLTAPDQGTYLWSTGSTAQTITVHNPGTYSVNIYHPGQICEDVYQFDVFSFSPPPATQLTDSICPGGMNQISLSSPIGGTSFLWNNGNTGPILGINNPGNYSLEVFQAGERCHEVFNWNVQPLTPPDAIQLLDSVCPGGRFPIELYADEPGVYSWNTGQTSQFISVNDTGLYVVQIFAAGLRCPRTLAYTVIPDTCIARPDLFLWVPNAFTANTDDLNDYFLPIFSDPRLVADYELLIYNRWGQQVFKTEDLTQPWIGNHKDGEYYAHPEIFVYIIEYRQVDVSERIRLRGHITVIR